MNRKIFTNETAYLRHYYLEDFATILDGLTVVQTAIHEYLLKDRLGNDSGIFSDNDFARLAGMAAAVTQKLANDAYQHIERLDDWQKEIDKASKAHLDKLKAA